LGRGGMGTVYLAGHVSLPKTFAVKLLHERYHERKDIAARFLQEAQAVSRVVHSNVIGVVDFGDTEDGAPFLVMEHLRGEPLDVLCKQAPLPWPRIRRLMLQVCRGLQAAHDVGIVHRDIKPANILRISVGEDHDVLKILDFGLAKIQDTGGLRLTRTGMVLGTPEYMAPEQARGGRIDHRTDIYATGVMLYLMLCGKPPFAAKTFEGMRNQHLLASPEPPSTRAPEAGITEEMEAIALRALAKDPSKRFASMREMAEAIEHVGQGRPPVPLLERSTKPLGLTQASMIGTHGRLAEASGPRKPMTWASGEDEPAPESVVLAAAPRQQPASARPLLIAVVAAAALSAAVVVLWAQSQPDERAPVDAASDPDAAAPPVLDDSGAQPDAQVGAGESEGGPALETGDSGETADTTVDIELVTNVPVRVLEAADQAILADTGTTLELPRGSEPIDLLLRADGYQDLAVSITPDRGQRLEFELEPRPSPATVPRPRPTPSHPQVEPEPEPAATTTEEPDNRFAPEIRDPWQQGKP
ncbi:MAG: protein kinase, partial [Myxococcales bacterium]|nr:protein kinase [Myxococcales bacterium]